MNPDAPLDSRLSYVAMHRFFEKISEAGNEDLGGLLGSMCLSLDGERSMDPAMTSDWTKVTDSKTSFTENEAFAAARAFLVQHYKRGPLPETEGALNFMGGVMDQEPNAPALRLWHGCWNEVRENALRGVPFTTAYCYGRNPEGLRGRFQRNEFGSIEFVADTTK